MNPSTLGAHCANPQPHHTAEGNAHDAIHPLDSAPLPQRRPWAILSTRAVIAVYLSAIAASGSTWIYAEKATLVPVTRSNWILLLVVLWSALFVAYVGAAVVFMICTDASAEQRGGPEADAHRNP